MNEYEDVVANPEVVAYPALWAYVAVIAVPEEVAYPEVVELPFMSPMIGDRNVLEPVNDCEPVETNPLMPLPANGIFIVWVDPSEETFISFPVVPILRYW